MRVFHETSSKDWAVYVPGETTCQVFQRVATMGLRGKRDNRDQAVLGNIRGLAQPEGRDLTNTTDIQLRHQKGQALGIWTMLQKGLQ